MKLLYSALLIPSLAATALLGLSCGSHRDAPQDVQAQSAAGSGSAAPAASSGQSCGDGHGTCIAKASAPSDFPNLPADSCTNQEVCVPHEILADPNYRFPSCNPMIPAIAAAPGPNGQLGGCVPLYLIPAEFKGSTFQEDCPSADLTCSPCNIPFMGEKRTGACPAK